MRISGDMGELRVGYQQAAQLGAWRLEQLARVPRAYEFRAEVRSTHPYWILKRPIDLVICVGQTEWRWRDVPIELQGNEAIVDLTEKPLVSARDEAQQGAKR